MDATFRSSARLLAAIMILVGATLTPFSRSHAELMPASSLDKVSSLDSLVQEAMARSPYVIAAERHWRALTRAPIQMRTLPDPQLQVQEFTVGSPKPSAGYETSDFYYTGIGASQDIPGPGKLGLQGEIAEKDAEVARYQYQAAMRDAAERVRENYFELFYLTRTLDLLEQQRSDLQQIEETAKAQYRVGRGQAQDVLKAQLQATQILNEIEHHHRETQQHEADLKAMLGRDLDSPAIAIGDVTPTHVDLSDAQLTDAVRTQSPDLAMALAAHQRGEKALSLARRGYLPDFSIGYAYEKTGPGVRDYYMLTLGAKIPLYFWRKQTPAIEQAELELEAAKSQVRGSELNAGASAEDRMVAIRASDRVLNIYKSGLLPQAQNSMQAAMAAYRVSKADFQTLISAFVDLRNVNQEYYREIADHEIAVAKLEQIVGDLK